MLEKTSKDWKKSLKEMENDLNKKDKGLDNFLNATCCERESDSFPTFQLDKCV